MAAPTAHILGILSDNLRRRKSVVHLSPRQATAWTRGLAIRRSGDTVIYTGQMYQLMPFISAMEKNMGRFEDSWVSRFFGIGRAINKAIDLTPFLARPDSHEIKEYNDILRNIVCLLEAAGVSFGYLYEKELYSGALLYDEGLDDVFETQVHRVYDLFRKNGVKRVITVDPHTTNMLRSVYPRIIGEFTLEVKSYLEVLAERDIRVAKELNTDVVIHDSCVYARYEGVVDEPRHLLARVGIEVREADYSLNQTYCCGGPVESLYPSKARGIADNRIKQLMAKGRNVVAMCPICLLNLKEAGEGHNVRVRDISEYLTESYCGTQLSHIPGSGNSLNLGEEVALRGNR